MYSSKDVLLLQLVAHIEIMKSDVAACSLHKRMALILLPQTYKEIVDAANDFAENSTVAVRKVGKTPPSS